MQVSSLSDAQKSFEEKLEKLPVSPSLPQTEVLVSRAAFRTHPSIIEKIKLEQSLVEKLSVLL